MKKTLMIIVSVAILMLTITVALATSKFDIWKSAGQSVNSNKNIKIAASINGRDVSEKRVQVYLKLNETASKMNNQLLSEMDISENDKRQIMAKNTNITREQALDKIIAKEVILQEAQKLGLMATEAEISEYFSQLEDALSKADPQSVYNAENILQAYCDGLGMSRKQYRQEIETEMVREEITIKKLMDYYFTTTKTLSEASQDEMQNAFNTYVEELRKDAEIVIY